jgi:hypothetical protein
VYIIEAYSEPHEDFRPLKDGATAKVYSAATYVEAADLAFELKVQNPSFQLRVRYSSVRPSRKRS